MHNKNTDMFYSASSHLNYKLGVCEILKALTDSSQHITVDFTLLYRLALRSSLGNWVLGYEVANYVANYVLKLRTSKRSSQLRLHATLQLRKFTFL